MKYPVPLLLVKGNIIAHTTREKVLFDLGAVATVQFNTIFSIPLKLIIQFKWQNYEKSILHQNQCTVSITINVVYTIPKSFRNIFNSL